MGIELGDDGVFRAADAPASPREHDATTLHRASPACDCPDPAGSPHRLDCPANALKVTVYFADGGKQSGVINFQEWGKIKEGKLQSFVLDITEPHHKSRRQAVIRWWACRSVEEQ